MTAMRHAGQEGHCEPYRWNPDDRLGDLAGLFLHSVLSDFARLCEARADQARAGRYREERLASKLELAWDGEWYRRRLFFMLFSPTENAEDTILLDLAGRVKNR